MKPISPDKKEIRFMIEALKRTGSFGEPSLIYIKYVSWKDIDKAIIEAFLRGADLTIVNKENF